MTLGGALRATTPINSQDVVPQDVEQVAQPHHDEGLPVNESKQEPVQPAGGDQATPGAALSAAMAVAKEQASKATAKATGGAKAKRAQT
jgi:hypothetical protein